MTERYRFSSHLCHILDGRGCGNAGYSYWCHMAECNCWVNKWIRCIRVGWNYIHIVEQNVTAECIIGYIALGSLFFEWLQFNSMKFEFVMTQFRSILTLLTHAPVRPKPLSKLKKKCSRFIADKKIFAVLCKSCDLHNRIRWNYNFMRCM